MDGGLHLQKHPAAQIRRLFDASILPPGVLAALGRRGGAPLTGKSSGKMTRKLSGKQGSV
jgi:hypothetical protein